MNEPLVQVDLSAERVSTTTRRRPRERVRVRREVVTEEVQVTVTVRREVLRLDGGPAGPADGAPSAPAGGGDDGELVVTLSQERPVVSLEVVPYERVRLAVREVATVTGVSVTGSHEEAVVELAEVRDRA